LRAPTGHSTDLLCERRSFGEGFHPTGRHMSRLVAAASMADAGLASAAEGRAAAITANA
jgi:hypothetical protein